MRLLKFLRDIGKRSGGAFLVRLEVPSNVDKDELEQKSKQLYELRASVEYYQVQLQMTEEQLSSFKEQLDKQLDANANLTEAVKTLAKQSQVNIIENANIFEKEVKFEGDNVGTKITVQDE